MKNLLVVLIILSAAVAKAQDPFKDLEAKNDFRPVMTICFLPGKATTSFPKYIDGRAGLNKFIEAEITYPEEAINQKLEGVVVVSYTIDKKGTMVKASKTEEGVQEELLINELIRVVEKSGPWVPAKSKNKYKKMTMELSYEFAL